jgi:copper chaperone
MGYDWVMLAVYVVPGMSCAHCEAAVTEAVRSVTGVTAVSIDLASKRVEVTGTELPDAAIRAAIEDAGYDVQ